MLSERSQSPKGLYHSISVTYSRRQALSDSDGTGLNGGPGIEGGGVS